MNDFMLLKRALSLDRADNHPVGVRTSRLTEIVEELDRGTAAELHKLQPKGDLLIERSEMERILREIGTRAAFAFIVAWGAGPRLDLRRDLIQRGLRDENIEFMMNPQQVVTGSSKNFKDIFAKLWDPQETARGLVKGLGTAFGTKVLYWASRREAQWPRPLIYDQRVHGALWSLPTHWGAQERFDHPWECVRYACYEAYCEGSERSADLLNALGNTRDYGFRSDDIELWLFQTGGGRPGHRFSGCTHGGWEAGGPDDVEEPPDEDIAINDPWPVLSELNLRLGSWKTSD